MITQSAQSVNTAPHTSHPLLSQFSKSSQTRGRSWHRMPKELDCRCASIEPVLCHGTGNDGALCLTYEHTMLKRKTSSQIYEMTILKSCCKSLKVDA